MEPWKLKHTYCDGVLVTALRYKQEGCGFYCRRGNLDFSSTQSFRPHYGPGVDSTFNINEYQGYLLEGAGLTLPCLGILADSTSRSPQNISRPVQDCCTVLIKQRAIRSNEQRITAPMHLNCYSRHTTTIGMSIFAILNQTCHRYHDNVYSARHFIYINKTLHKLYFVWRNITQK
jgi:hypothetical protein